MARNEKLITVKNEALARSIERKENLAALSDYIGFATTKLFGFAALITGAIEIVNPNFHPITLLPPESVLAFGLALLTGPKVINIFAKIVNALK
jgi:hypothetical protein